jgi:transposase
LELTRGEREQLERWAGEPESSQTLALRSNIVLKCASGLTNLEVAASLNCSNATVGKWRARFCEDRLDGLADKARPGRPRMVTAQQVDDVIMATLEEIPENGAHWSRAKMAERTGLSESTVGRIWKTLGIRPRREERSGTPNGWLPTKGVCTVVGLYLDPPESAVAVSAERSPQGLAETLPAPQVKPETRVRRGNISLVAAFDDEAGKVVSSVSREQRAAGFGRFLAKMEAEVPGYLDVHLICDNRSTVKTPAVQGWLAAHPRFRTRFAAAGPSWLNEAERLLAFVMKRLMDRSVEAFEPDART